MYNTLTQTVYVDLQVDLFYQLDLQVDYLVDLYKKSTFSRLSILSRLPYLTEWLSRLPTLISNE